VYRILVGKPEGKRSLVAGLPIQRARIKLKPVNVGFVMNKVALGQAYFRVLITSPVSIILSSTLYNLSDLLQSDLLHR
jgi:hypothetical protein